MVESGPWELALHSRTLDDRCKIIVVKGNPVKKDYKPLKRSVLGYQDLELNQELYSVVQ